MTESTPIATPTTVPGHAELRAQATELRLHGLLAHWDELMGQPETEQRVRQWLGWESVERANRSLDPGGHPNSPTHGHLKFPHPDRASMRH